MCVYVSNCAIRGTSLAYTPIREKSLNNESLRYGDVIFFYKHKQPESLMISLSHPLTLILVIVI